MPVLIKMQGVAGGTGAIRDGESVFLEHIITILTDEIKRFIDENDLEHNLMLVHKPSDLFLQVFEKDKIENNARYIHENPLDNNDEPDESFREFFMIDVFHHPQSKSKWRYSVHIKPEPIVEDIQQHYQFQYVSTPESTTSGVFKDSKWKQHQHLVNIPLFHGTVGSSLEVYIGNYERESVYDTIETWSDCMIPLIMFALRQHERQRLDAGYHPATNTVHVLSMLENLHKRIARLEQMV